MVKYRLMSEQTPASHEQIVIPVKRERLAYSPIPLDPWSATDPETGVSYYLAALERLEEKAAAVISASRFLDDAQKSAVGDFLLSSLVYTHTNRVDYNHDSFQTLNDLDTPCDTLRYAREGTATPSELIDILTTHPEIRSLELAKLSHPLDFSNADELEMDQAIIAALSAKNALLPNSSTRYKSRRFEESIPAMILTRKQDIGMIPLDTTRGIYVVRRQSLLVRGDLQSDSSDAKKLLRTMKNPERLSELADRIETYFQYEFDPDNQFVQPAATSYYAKIVPRLERQ